MNINSLHKNVLDGHKNAEKELFQALTERFRVILQHKLQEPNDIEDILQDTLMTISSKYKGIEFTISFSAWAYKVLNNNIINYYRTRATKRRKESELTPEILETQALNTDPILKIKLIDCFKKMCQTNKRYGTIISLHFEGFYVEEISKKLKVSVNNVYVLMSRARAMLKNCLEKGELS